MKLLTVAGVVPAPVAELTSRVQAFLRGVGMVGLRSAVQLPELRRLRSRPLVRDLGSWGLLPGGALLGVLAVGPA